MVFRRDFFEKINLGKKKKKIRVNKKAGKELTRLYVKKKKNRWEKFEFLSDCVWSLCIDIVC